MKKEKEKEKEKENRRWDPGTSINVQTPFLPGVFSEGWKSTYPL